MPETNIHGTAIVIGTRGLIFLGPSGSGKSMLAFTCLAAARRIGLFSALISDDQIMVSLRDGQVIARPPAAITGMIELRGSGIVTTETIAPALLHHAILPVRLGQPLRQTGAAGGREDGGAERLPPEGEEVELFNGAVLPLTRLNLEAADPLAILAAFIPFNGKA